MLEKLVQLDHRQGDHGHNKLTSVDQQKSLCAEWLDGGDDLSGLSVQQNDGNDESDTMPIVTIKNMWLSHGKLIEADIKKLTTILSLAIILFAFKIK